MTWRSNILVDIDHTLSNAFWRDPMIGVSTWDEYHAASVDDVPINDVKFLISAMKTAGYNIIGFTARPAKFRQLTMNWCIKHSIPIDELLMRLDADFRPAPEIKMALAIARFENIKNEVAFIMDDREDVCAVFKGIGITALQVHGRAR